ncbi:MAG TPA: DNA polymerase III subunit gamma/tau [Gammaproteobacteria bacterium]
MSYKVLAVKWRPRRFEQLVGQPHVVQALVNSLKDQRLHHAYLFTGTRGVGKTTVARVLAKALNCAQGVVAEPCGTCEACVAIDEGRFVDLIEVDAASRTRVDDTRELLDNVQYAPSRGRFKVYLIDEVHMLSTHSFNALLKTLEEPPPHVKFLLATTDPQKLPITVLSRCLQFNLKKLTVAQIQGQLEKIAAAEGFAAEPEALRALARAADGSMRDALSLLDQALAFGGGAVELARVNEMLGTIDRGHVLRLLDALARGDGAGLLDQVDALDELAPDYGAMLDELLAALQNMAVLQLVGPRAGGEERAELAELAAKVSPEDTQLYYQIALQGRRDLPVCRDARMGFEMTLLRMLAFRPLEADAATSGAGTAQDAGQQSPRAAAAPATSSPAAAPAAPSASGAAPDWHALLAEANIRGAARQLADHCELESVVGDAWNLVLAAEKAHLNTQQLRARLEAALAEHLGRAIRLNVVPGKPRSPTPAEVRAAGESERLRQAREALERDPNVKAVQDAFDAVLEADSIRPAGN